LTELSDRQGGQPEGLARLQGELTRSKARYRRMFDSVAVALWEEDHSRLRGRIDELRAVGVNDMRGYCSQQPAFVSDARQLVRVLDVNCHAVRLFRAASKDQLLSRWEQTFDDSSDEAFVEAIVALAEGRLQFETERVARTFDGDRLHVQVSVQLPPVADPGAVAIVSMVDLTEHKLRRLLLERALTAQEEERRRLARELHDEAGQALTSVAVGLQQLQQAPDLPTARARATRLQAVVKSTIDEVGRLARGLHPCVLEDYGLVEALERHIAELASLHQLSIDFQLIGELPEGDPCSTEATAIYRIVQEALRNVIRHAEASHVSVILNWAPHRVRLVVEDDGKGFDPYAIPRIDPGQVTGLGLHGMRERVELLSGTLQVDSVPGGGTTLAIRIPL
jgi:signal transduction histidine kinase